MSVEDMALVVAGAGQLPGAVEDDPQPENENDTADARCQRRRRAAVTTLYAFVYVRD